MMLEAYLDSGMTKQNLEEHFDRYSRHFSKWWDQDILPDQMEKKYRLALEELQDEGKPYED